MSTPNRQKIVEYTKHKSLNLDIHELQPKFPNKMILHLGSVENYPKCIQKCQVVLKLPKMCWNLAEMTKHESPQIQY